MDFGQAVEKYITHCEYEKKLAPKTIRAYRLDLRQFKYIALPYLADQGVESINKHVVSSYIKYLNKTLKPKSVKRKVATLRAFLNYLVYEEILSINPFHKIAFKTPQDHRLPKVISVNNIKKLFTFVQRRQAETSGRDFAVVVRDIAVLEVLFATGVRVFELCRLRIKDVDLTAGSLRVNGKGNRERVVPICAVQTMAALKDYSDLWLTNRFGSAEPFFRNNSQRPLTDQSVRSMVAKYSELAELDQKVTPHMFRHTVATLLLANGVDIRYIQRFLGHSSILVTEIYTHVSDELQREAIFDRHPRRTLW